MQLLTFQGLSTPPRLPFPCFAQVCIEPAAEPILLVPGTLSVANQHQLVSSHNDNVFVKKQM